MYKRPKGTKDIFGDRQVTRNYVIENIKMISSFYNFKQIETPIFEKQETYIRSVGETSDIVSKEMYNFEDKKGRSMVLRPEGTAGTIRAIVENKLYTQPLPLKLFYLGAMFRYENPQKGRQRQFTQFGVEMICEKNPYLDAEIILMASNILSSLKIEYEIQINSLGDKVTRDNYSKALKEYFLKHQSKLTQDSIKRIDKNPLRILDDKIDGEKDFVKNAPKIEEYYSKESKEYFESLKSFLDTIDIPYKVNNTLVRGLDYYSDTIFEFVSTSSVAGSQSTIIGGGRYDNLINEFGGPELSGIGFGLGIERLVNEVEAKIDINNIKVTPDIFVLNITSDKQEVTLGIVYALRCAGFITEWNSKPLKLQKAFTKADNAKAKIFLIAGEKELQEGKVAIKYKNKQETVDLDSMVSHITKLLGENNENK